MHVLPRPRLTRRHHGLGHGEGPGRLLDRHHRSGAGDHVEEVIELAAERGIAFLDVLLVSEVAGRGAGGDRRVAEVGGEHPAVADDPDRPAAVALDVVEVNAAGDARGQRHQHVDDVRILAQWKVTTQVARGDATGDRPEQPLDVVPFVRVVERQAVAAGPGEARASHLERLVGADRGVERHRRADRPSAEQLLQPAHHRQVTEHVADEHRHAGRRGRRRHLVRSGDGVAHGLLHQHRRPGPAGRDGERCVERIGGGDHHAVAGSEQLVDVRHRRDAGEFGRRALVLVEHSDGDLLALGEQPGMASPDRPEAHHADGERCRHDLARRNGVGSGPVTPGSATSSLTVASRRASTSTVAPYLSDNETTLAQSGQHGSGGAYVWPSHGPARSVPSSISPIGSRRRHE